MSWSIWGLKVEVNEVMEPTLRADVAAKMAEQGTLFDAPETKEQVEAAIDLVLTAIRTHGNALGGTTFAVGMAGHSNPGHAKREGWANDAISINVSAA